MIPFQYQLIDGSLISPTNEFVGSNTNISLASSSSSSLDTNQTNTQSLNSAMRITKSPQNTTNPMLHPVFHFYVQAQPRLLSYNSYVSSTGSMHIVGEVTNESYQPIRSVEIIATFYDAYNNVIGTDSTFTKPSTLQPGQRAPFDMIIIEGSIPTYLMVYYTLSLDYSNLYWNYP
jgi:hypothetical protein